MGALTQDFSPSIPLPDSENQDTTFSALHSSSWLGATTRRKRLLVTDSKRGTKRRTFYYNSGMNKTWLKISKVATI